MPDNYAFIGVTVADPSIAWPKRGEAEKHFCERDGWEFRKIPSVSRGRPIKIDAMCNGVLAVNIMIDDEGFAISLASTGFRISYGGSVFARCDDAMQAAETMMAEHPDWESIQSRGVNDMHRSVLRGIIKAAEKRGEIMLDRVYPT